MEVKTQISEKNRCHLEVYIDGELWKIVWKSLFQRKITQIKKTPQFFQEFEILEKQAAERYALNLLAKRALTEKQLTKSLENKLFPSSTISWVLENKVHKYLDRDIERHIEVLVSRGKGPLWLRQYLQTKFDLSSQQISQKISESIDDLQFLQQAKELLKKKYKNIKEYSTKQKAYRFLAARGYTPDQIYRAINLIS